MRAVADALGVTPMALYHHVADKAALIELVIEATLDEYPLPPVSTSWEDNLAALAHWDEKPVKRTRPRRSSTANTTAGRPRCCP